MNEEIFQAAFVDEFDKIAGLKGMARKGALGLALLGGGTGCVPSVSKVPSAPSAPLVPKVPAKAVAKAPEMPKKNLPRPSKKRPKWVKEFRLKWEAHSKGKKARDRRAKVIRGMKGKREQEHGAVFQKRLKENLKRLKENRIKEERIYLMKRRRKDQIRRSQYR